MNNFKWSILTCVIKLASAAHPYLSAHMCAQLEKQDDKWTTFESDLHSSMQTGKQDVATNDNTNLNLSM